jgi:hypothetical protein
LQQCPPSLKQFWRSERLFGGNTQVGCWIFR